MPKVSAVLALVAWLVTFAAAQPCAAQVEEHWGIVGDGPGITVWEGGQILGRPAVRISPYEMKGIEGVVVLELTLDPEGAVSDARVRSGPEGLRQWAMDAVREWRYAKGESLPTTVVATIERRTPEETSPPISDTSPQREIRIRVRGSVQAARLIERISPEYPAQAREEGVEGVVRLLALLNKEGRLADIEVESGHPQLVPAAVKAVKNWVWRPALLNGEPVEVLTTVDVPFTLE